MSQSTNTAPRRRLSPIRLMVALLLVAGLISAGVAGQRQWQAAQSAAEHDPWFAGYVDVTATPTFAFEQMGTDATKNAVLSFIVASKTDGCEPTWGAAYTMDQASAVLDLDRRIARLQQQDGSIAVSFGGLKNDELAVACDDVDQLFTSYKSVIERYDVDTIDLDLEGVGLTDAVAGERRAKAIAKLQNERRQNGKSLAIWLTLPVSPVGLTEDGTNIVAQMLAHGVDISGVNAMTMNYSSSRVLPQSMIDASKSALNETYRQLGVLYQQAGIYLSDATLWTKIGATPMIGQNDVTDDVFTLEDAIELNRFASANGMGRLSMWSTNRDVPCGGNYVDTQFVSDSCSGVDAEEFAFANALVEDFDGNVQLNASVVTTQEDGPDAQEADDPETSPYQIWSDNGAYLQGTKVVWHKNVYEAKWWTQGDLPDNPVLQSWETPWKLIGPVLPGERPIPQATVPAGTYPQWTGKETYDAGTRILFEGIPYQAKWWNQGESPAAAASNPDNSPWVPLTQAQINKLLQ